MLELKRLKELQHDNITRFVGACLDPGTMFGSAPLSGMILFVRIIEKNKIYDYFRSG